MSEIFSQRNMDFNLLSETDFKQGPANTVNYGLKSLQKQSSGGIQQRRCS